MAATLIDSILDTFTEHLDEDVKVYSGEPGIEGYPFVVINDLRWSRPTYNSKRIQHQREETFQVTVAALDPKTAETIGLECEAIIKPVEDGGFRLQFDGGYEINRMPGPGRTHRQYRVGPNLLTVFYYSFDVQVFTGRAK